MASTRRRTEHELDDFPVEIREEMLRMRDQRGKTIAPTSLRSPGETGVRTAGSGTSSATGSSGSDGPPTQHVRAREDGWEVIKEGSDRATRVLDTKSEAVEVAREMASNQGAKLVIHRADGSVQEERDYS